MGFEKVRIEITNINLVKKCHRKFFFRLKERTKGFWNRFPYRFFYFSSEFVG